MNQGVESMSVVSRPWSVASPNLDSEIDSD